MITFWNEIRKFSTGVQVKFFRFFLPSPTSNYKTNFFTVIFLRFEYFGNIIQHFENLTQKRSELCNRFNLSVEIPKDIWSHPWSAMWLTLLEIRHQLSIKKFDRKSQIETSTGHRVAYSKIWLVNRVFSGYAILLPNGRDLHSKQRENEQ